MVDEGYVSQILRDMPARLSIEQFRARVQPDRNAGYAAECQEAERRYFAPTLTPATRRALEAVKAGQCERRYTMKGNTMHGPKGVSSQSLWYAEGARYIKDGPSHGGAGIITVVPLILTDAGRKALEGNGK